MSKCIDDFNEITKQLKHDLEYGELNGSAVKTAYLGMIAGYLATIVDQLDEMNNKETKEEKDKLLDIMAKERNVYAQHIAIEEAKLRGKVEGAEYMTYRLLDYLRGNENGNDD